MSNTSEVLRTQQINLKLTEEELARLERLAAHYALSPQSVLRMLLKQASDSLASKPTPKPKGRK
jgi:hypothetical protein